MKRLILFFVFAMLLGIQSYAQTGVAINATGNNPDNSAMLDVSSNEKGILIPRMTEAQRTAIDLPATGLLVYQNDGTEGFYYYDGSVWTRLAGGTVTDVSATTPIVSTGGTSPVISISAATTTAAGSMSSADKTKLDGLISSQWTTTGSNIYYSTGNVGIGSTDLSQKLNVDGSVLIPSGQSYWIGSASGIGNRLRLHHTNSKAYIDWGEDALYFRSGVTSSTNRVIFTGDGKVVIPALSSAGVLMNNASGVISSSIGTNGQVLTTNGSGSLSWASPNSGTVTSVTGTAPISVVSGSTTPAIDISPATTSAAGSMSAADKTKLDGINGSETYIIAGSNITVTGTGTSIDPYVVNAVNALLPPTATAIGATSILANSATLNGSVNANGLMTTIDFEYGLTTAYGNISTSSQSPVTGSNNTIVNTAISGLQENTTYHYRVKATNAVDKVYSDDMSFNTQLSLPELTTASVSSILAFTATSGGNITAQGASAVSSRGICYSTSANPTIANNTVSSGAGTGIFVANMSGLTQGTTYNVRAFATNSSGTAYGNEVSFTTQNGIVALTTTAISSITGVSATSGGNISADGGSPVTARGICYATSSTPTIANSTVSGGSGNGSFSSNLTGLTIGTTYYVRAYATNSTGTYYGTQISFSTVALPTLTTANFSDVKGNSAKAGGSVTNNGGSVIITQGLCWSTNETPTTGNSITTSFTDEITGLSPNTMYYVRAYATNIAGTGYGNQISFNSGYLIGENHAGGLVFYNNGSGNGLVCATSDQSSGAQWGCYGTLIGGTSMAFGTGDANTTRIVTNCTTAGIAAQICYDLSLNSYTDWYLPSLNELELIYLNLKVQNLGGLANDHYYSSSENTNTAGYGYSFHPLAIGSFSTSKTTNCRVRAIRSF